MSFLVKDGRITVAPWSTGKRCNFKHMNGDIVAYDEDYTCFGNNVQFSVPLGLDIYSQLAMAYEQGVEVGRKLGKNEKAAEIAKALERT